MKKRILVSVIFGLILILSAVIPVNAAPPGEETWPFADARNGTIYATFDINTNTLKTSYFHFYNNSSTFWAVPHVELNGVTVWHYNLAPNSTYDYRFSVNFQRLPATDPDDPNSIRYPNNYSFGLWTGENISESPYN